MQNSTNNLKLQLAIDARSAQYQEGGVPRYSVDLIRSLAPYAEAYNFLFVVDKNLPTDHISFPSSSKLLLTSASKSHYARDLWEQLVLPQQLKSGCVDLFHGLDYIAPWTPCRFKRVVTFHDATVFSPYDNRSFLAKSRLKFMIHRTAAAASAIVTDSDFSLAQLEHYVPHSRNKITRIWPGVSDIFLQAMDNNVLKNVLDRLPQNNSFLLYYGGYRSHKRVDLLLNAFAHVAPTYPYNLVLVGSTGASEPNLRSLCRKLHLEDRVIFFGYASDAELRALLDQCTLFVFPSVVEGFGLPVMEAMTCGAPVVSSTGGSLPEIAGEAAIYFQGESAEALAGAILKTLADENLRNSLAQTGKRRSRQFRWSVTAQQLTELYAEVTQRQHFERAF